MCGHGLIGLVRTLEFLGRLAPGALRIDTPVGTRGRRARGRGRGHDRERPGLLPRAGRRAGRARPRPRHGRRRLGRKLVLPDRARGTAARARERRGPHRRDVAHPRGAALRRASRAGTAPRSTTSSSSARRTGRTPTRATSCSAPASPTTARPAAPGPRPSWPCSPRAARSRPGQRWRQESITGSLFEGWLEEKDGALVPHIRGRAYVTGRATLFFDPSDPFREGFTAAR